MGPNLHVQCRLPGRNSALARERPHRPGQTKPPRFSRFLEWRVKEWGVGCEREGRCFLCQPRAETLRESRGPAVQLLAYPQTRRSPHGVGFQTLSGARSFLGGAHTTHHGAGWDRAEAPACVRVLQHVHRSREPRAHTDSNWPCDISVAACFVLTTAVTGSGARQQGRRGSMPPSQKDPQGKLC